MSERANKNTDLVRYNTLKSGSNLEDPLTGNGNPPSALTGFVFPSVMCLDQMWLRTFPEQGVALCKDLDSKITQKGEDHLWSHDC